MARWSMLKDMNQLLMIALVVTALSAPDA